MYMYNTVYMYMEYSLTKTKKTARKTYSYCRCNDSISCIYMVFEIARWIRKQPTLLAETHKYNSFKLCPFFLIHGTFLANCIDHEIILKVILLV